MNCRNNKKPATLKPFTALDQVRIYAEEGAKVCKLVDGDYSKGKREAYENIVNYIARIKKEEKEVKR